MLNALLEIGTEEIPARFMPGLLADLKARAEEKLRRERISYGKIETLGTSRRLTLYLEDLSPRQSDLAEEVKGPPAERAFDAFGKPAVAAIGFAKAQGVPVEKLVLRPINDRNYVFAKVVRRGKAAEKVLQTLFPEIITSLYQPLSMRWGDSDFKFVRPIHSLLALCGKKVVRFKLAGIKSGGKTFGHRFTKVPSPKSQVPSADLLLYKKQLLKLGVMVDQQERKEAIRRQVEAAAEKAGGQALLEEYLLSEVTYLVENPVVYAGRFKPGFLEIPQVVLITSMKKNQKYFPVVKAQEETAILPAFVVVTDGCPNPKVAEGNEKVLSARLSDARFFFEEDRKTPLGERVSSLSGVAFLERLGDMRQKTERLEQLAGEVGSKMRFEESELRTARRIARLCKTDLTTKMVYEFPELQGAMGQVYALLAGEPPEVAEGIFEHYLPRFADDKLPERRESLAVAAADRLDLIVGAFSAGYVPTGSEDPYGVRRAVHGVIRLILEKRLTLPLSAIIEYSWRLHQASFADLPDKRKEALDFIASRLRSVLLEKGMRYDAADAALFEFNDILKTEEKARALNSLLKEEWFPGIVASVIRLTRIAGQSPRRQITEQDLAEKEEKELYQLYRRFAREIAEKIEKEQWEDAIRGLIPFTNPIEAFFDKVLVLHKDERLKLNRLALLKALEELYLSVADFRKIVM